MRRCTQWRDGHGSVEDNSVNYIDRLARYEDTGFSPEELAALSAPHGELVDRNAILSDLYALRKTYRAAGADTLPLCHAIHAARSAPTVVPSNYDAVEEEHDL